MKVLEKEVIYVGISSKSLRNRDFRQHFNGNAGSSTLRKSIGSLFGFKKIPRSQNQDDGKTKFNERDESFISDWMRRNLEFYYLAVLLLNCDIIQNSFSIKTNFGIFVPILTILQILYKWL